MPTHTDLRMVTYYKLQDTAKVRGFKQDQTFVGESVEQSHRQYTHNPALIESMPCTGAAMSAGQLPR